jgi:tetratricopeptide (TPR) repeat protein
MRKSSLRDLLYSFFLLSGVACLALAYQQCRYTHFLAAGHRAVIEQRFDSQDYAQASHLWFANHERLLFNQGVLAYKAGNLPRATDLFRRVSQSTPTSLIQPQAFYNLGVVLLDLQEAPGAAEYLKQALRLDPHDKDAKFALERLYQTLQRQGEEHREAASAQGDDRHEASDGGLKPAPGLGQEEGKGSSGNGQGRSPTRPGI